MRSQMYEQKCVQAPAYYSYDKSVINTRTSNRQFSNCLFFFVKLLEIAQKRLKHWVFEHCDKQ